MVDTFTPISPGQIRALARLERSRLAPKKFIVAHERETGNLIVVPPSTKDQRRWDITKGGKITRKTR